MVIKQKTKERNVDTFNLWMAEKVKSVYYADNKKMFNAYEKLQKI